MDAKNSSDGVNVGTDAAKAANDNAEVGNSPLLPRPKPERAEAEKFIAALTGSAETAVTFQTFVDDKRGGPPPWSQHGKLGDLWESLVALNEQGHGVFVMINEGDGKGRKEANVVAARSVFIDDDGKGPAPVVFDKGKPPFDKLAPNITVQSKAGQHHYWLLSPGEALDTFTPMQVALAKHFGTDKSVKDIPRVMRVPGFLHQKDRQAPILVRVVQTANGSHKMDQLRDAYGLTVVGKDESAPATATKTQVAVEDDRSTRINRARAYVAKVPGAVQGDHGDEATFKLCCSVARGFDLTEDEALSVLTPWNASCQPPWSEDELRKKIQSALAHGKEEIGGRLDDGDGDEANVNLVNEAVEYLKQHFALLRLPDGTERTFAINERREVTLLLTDSWLRKGVHDKMKVEHGVIVSDKMLGGAIKLWRRDCAAMETEPEPFCFKGDDRLCFKRFDWLPKEGPFSAWEEFLKRLSDRDAFMAFLWSCFEPTNKSRQYLLLRGEGQDGKSAVLGVMHTVFGQAAASVGAAAVKEARFFNSSVYGKRIVLYPDCKNARFGMMEIVRTLTAGDPVLIEFKGETPFTARLRAKLFIASNYNPEVTSMVADQSRLIWVEVAESQNKDDPAWPNKLEAELPHFLWACKASYEKLCPHHGDIKVGEQTIERNKLAADAFEQRYHDLFNRYFEAQPGNKVLAAQVALRLHHAKLNNQEMADFKAWMDRTHKVKFDRTNKERFYMGLRLREGVVLDPGG
jgi:hypothetical protein